MKSRSFLAYSLVLAPLALAACGGDGTGATAPGQVQIRMGVSTGGVNASRAAAGPRFATGTGLTVTGTNGTLAITDIKLVVSRFELRGADGSSCGAATATGVHTDRSGATTGPTTRRASASSRRARSSSPCRWTEASWR